MRQPNRTEGEGMPSFARPLPSASSSRTAVSASRPGLSPIATAVALVSVSCLVLVLFARPDGAQSLPNSKTKKQTTHTAPVTETVSEESGTRHSVDFYTSNVRGSMFSAPVPAPPKPKPVVVKAPPKPQPPPIVPPMHIDPFAEWSYTGTVHQGDMVMALLENKRTKEGQYVKPGDSFMGAQVQNIDDHMVTLTNGGQPSMLAKADTMIITPLNASAAPTPQPGQPGQPGQPQNMQVQGMMTAPEAAPQLSITLPNGRVLTGDRATRYQQRLDRGFSGGGSNSGGGNGGGGGGRNRRGNARQNGQ